MRDTDQTKMNQGLKHAPAEASGADTTERQRCAALASELAAELRKRGELDAARGAQLVEEAIRARK